MLLVFSLSILPRNLLHDALSAHTDSFYLVQHSNLPTVEEKGFQCDQFQVVVDLPFLVTAPDVFDYALTLDKLKVKEEIQVILLDNIYHSSLRGPPTVPVML